MQTRFDNETKKSSSSRRFYNILSSVSKWKKGVNEPAWKAWAVALGDAEGPVDDTEFFLRLPKIWALLSQVRADAIALYEDDSAPLFQTLHQVEILLRPNSLNKPLGETINRISSQQILFGLDALAYELERSSTEVEVPAEILDEALDSITRIMNELSLDSEVETDLRVFLVMQLSEVREAIIDYRILGIKTIIDRMQQATGAIVLSQDVRDAGGGKNSAVQRAVGGITVASDVVTKSNKLIDGGKLLVGHFKNLLPHS